MSLMMNRAEVETQAPWALNYYDAGVQAGKNGPQQHMLPFDSWLNVNTHQPEVGQNVIYYLEKIGVWVGKYTGLVELSGWKEPQHSFSGEFGIEWVGDVTHWMPVPDKPIN